MKINVKKVGWHLVPADQESLEYIKKLSKTDDILVEVKRNRNGKFHKKIFALLKIGFDNTKLSIETSEAYREYILMKSGHFYVNTFPDYVQYKARSIAYDKLNQDLFDKLYPIVLQKVANDIGCSDTELEIQILNEF